MVECIVTKKIIVEENKARVFLALAEEKIRQGEFGGWLGKTIRCW